ncbi:hypothetical protein EYF80_010384 [Liparis tanakae]|uniref:Uncharacterized protein n=1 Tax=Liparis tanakae TaxID=230148 RepID=A0A4Z2IMU1_9TELE|nr:hypothetical protein EYF80_010384 [Liparis tanakae]
MSDRYFMPEAMPRSMPTSWMTQSAQCDCSIWVIPRHQHRREWLLGKVQLFIRQILHNLVSVNLHGNTHHTDVEVLWMGTSGVKLIHAYASLRLDEHPDDVGVVKLAHDRRLAQEVPPLTLYIAALQCLYGHGDLLLPRRSQAAAAHLAKLT